MKTTPIFLLLALFVSSFTFADENPSPEDTRPAVIFLPGYMGSFLRDTHTKDRIFITVSSAIGRPGTLSLFQKELQTPAGPDLEVDGVMDYVPAVFTKVDVYGSMMQQLGTLEGKQLLTFAYDWRQDPAEWVSRFAAFVAKLKARGVPTIDLVAHSGGGWIVSYYLAYGAQPPESARVDWSGAKNIRKVVLLGTPYYGGWPLFRELAKGSTLPLMGHLLPPDTMASFPSIYCTTPQDDGHILDAGGQAVRGGTLARAGFWQENHLGLLARTDLPDDVMKARADFTANELARCGKFMNLIQLHGAPPAPASLSMLSIVGTGTKTMDKSFLVQDHGQPRVLFDVDHPSRYGVDESLMYLDGDGSVPAPSSVLPAALAARARRLEAPGVGHAKLTTDKGLQQAVLEFLKD